MLKLLIIIFTALIAFLAFTKLDISLKNSGYIANYVKPFYTNNIAPKLTEQLSRLDSSIENDTVLTNITALNGVTAQVRRVIDGDTIDVFLDGEVQRVRYIGMNTPERNEPCYDEATDANRDLVGDETVLLVKDTSETDRFDRLLRYVYVGNTFVNAELVEQGFAEVALYRPDDKHHDMFRQAEQVAAEAGIGCHVSGVFDDNTFTR
jgi:endonuclease YncB( thermonuclease family)